ncbi:MAG: hypothetical protein DDT21_01558 [Syntrophomonadaceae bacterium]|nr:hypothetical protein [Bacillota bacterium]
MRPISPELLAKVKSRQQTLYNNAEPKLKLQFSRGLTSELFLVYTIQTKDLLQAVDVTVKRTAAGLPPSEVIAICLDNNVARVKSKPLPYNELTPWVDEFTVAPDVACAAIEFDGFWDRDWKTKRFNFITEEAPWIFYARGGVLYAKRWRDAPLALADNVDKVCAIRGWVPVDSDQANDQGLIAAYIKNGKVYYRSYCTQVNSAKLWEVEREVPGIAGAVTDLALFRTNDFRIGFLVTVGGMMRWFLTERNYAGMSVWPDLITAGIAGLSFGTVPVRYHDAFHPAESVTGSVDVDRFYVCPADAAALVLNVQRPTARTIVVTFNHALETAEKDFMAVRNVNGSRFYALSSVAINGKDLIVTTAADLPLGDAYLEMSQAGKYYVALRVTSACVLDYSQFSILAKGQPSEVFTDEALTAAVNSVAFVVIQVFYRDGYSSNENITAGIAHISFAVTRVGGNPL